QRDSLLKDMAGESQVNVEFDQYGRAKLQIGDQVIVDPDKGVTTKLSVVKKATAGQAEIVWNGDETTDSQVITGDFSAGDIVFQAAGQTNYTKLAVQSGAIGGLQESLHEVRQHQDELNDFAKGIAEREN